MSTAFPLLGWTAGCCAGSGCAATSVCPVPIWELDLVSVASSEEALASAERGKWADHAGIWGADLDETNIEEGYAARPGQVFATVFDYGEEKVDLSDGSYVSSTASAVDTPGRPGRPPPPRLSLLAGCAADRCVPTPDKPVAAVFPSLTIWADLELQGSASLTSEELVISYRRGEAPTVEATFFVLGPVSSLRDVKRE